MTELETLLASTLDEDSYLSFDQLKEPMVAAEFRPPPELAAAAPAPQEADFIPEPPSGLGALAPGRKRAHAAAAAQDGQITSGPPWRMPGPSRPGRSSWRVRELNMNRPPPGNGR